VESKIMQTVLAKAGKNAPKVISVGANECRLARQGERLVARAILADVVVTIQVPVAGFAAMLRFSVPEESSVSRQRMEVLWDFADQALELVFQSIRAMDIPTDSIVISAIGGADITGVTYGRGKQLALAIQRSFWKQGILPNGNDLGGSQDRMIWLESASGRLIVRSKCSGLNPAAEMKAQQSKAS
jgi:chemotaxis receptor (MCP) glutamine deamidase CheD